jgi:NADPH2:quinone reductase
VLKLAAEGKLTAKIDRVMPLREAAEAHRIVAGRNAVGKVLLDPTLG